MHSRASAADKSDVTGFRMAVMMRSYPKIWFLRHGQTIWNAEGRIQGQLESDLTDLGQEQARQQARLMSAVLQTNPQCRVSPLRRAQSTAQIALNGHPFQTDAKLAEIHAGDWQGQRKSDVIAGWPELADASTPGLTLFANAPGGEGLSAFIDRVQAVLSSLDGPTVLVAHGLWGQVLRGLIRGLSPADMAQLSNEQGCVYLLDDGTETVLR
jgi:probable phosphoglycerate mutase